ncbi:DUF3048 domain-containing protein [Candidatus Saccharibacteria bacterium]|nr:DUF3048 domain-containing protein [Candidatus Saccharibacteria bacterium]
MSVLARPSQRRQPSFLKKNWFQTHRRLIIIIAAVVVVAIAVAAIVISFFLNNHQTETSQITEPTKKTEPVRYYSPLTGRETTENKTAAPVLAVMIDNSVPARPQSGLTEAGVVFEAVAEGGITRFIALYQETEPSLIGPVRSVRPYYLEWAAAFDPGVAHVGGSDEALTMIHSGNYGVDLDQYYADSAYWRAKDRAAPSNVYTDYAHLLLLTEQKGKTTAKFTGLTRQALGQTIDETTENPATSIDLAISSGQYTVSYQYDQATKTYPRSVGGQPHFSRALDNTTTQIAPDVVVAIRVKQNLTNDNLHNQITTTGSGEAFIFQDGQVITGTWAKDSPTAQLKFFDPDGQEIKLKRGQTWITAVPSGKAITWQ